ncbi:MAG: flagellar hook-length control protein FliK [Enterocloster citroniae]|nr:flagellar hook-length control protein FliK [Enterocloster citroniae]
MVKIEMAQMRHPVERVKDEKASLDGFEIDMNFSQMLKGKEQAVQEQKPEKEDVSCKTEEADSIKKEPASILLQTDVSVQNPAETMVQLQAAFNQMLENVVNHTPDSELTNQEQPEPPLETGGTFAAVATTDVRPEQMTAAKAGDRRMPDYVELKAESSLHTMKPRAFLPDREAEASERDSELSQASFARVDKEMQPVILRDEHSGHQEAADWQKPSFKGKPLLDRQDRDGETLKEPVHAEYIHPVNSQEMSRLAAARNTPETVTVRTTPETFPVDVGKTIAAKLPGNNGMLTIELEPAALGKMTIKVVYEAGRAAVSIMSANPKTLELLSQSAGEIANILEEKTGQQTVVYTPEAYQQSDDYRGHQERDNQRQEDEREKRRSQPDSFAQQLRLGLV